MTKLSRYFLEQTFKNHIFFLLIINNIKHESLVNLIFNLEIVNCNLSFQSHCSPFTRRQTSSSGNCVVSFSSLKTSAATDMGGNSGRDSAVAWHSITKVWNKSLIRRREPSSIVGIGPEHKVLVPSLVDVRLTESLSIADPVPQSPHHAPAHSEGLSSFLSVVEDMEAVQMLKVFSGCVLQSPNNRICLRGDVVSYAHLHMSATL